MELTLRRIVYTEQSTMGELSLNGVAICFILEDRYRQLDSGMPLDEIKRLKEPGKTAIPTGRYEIIITQSNRFKKPLPLLLNVPGFEGIRIHPGNTALDTEGCLLPGTKKFYNAVGYSKVAFEILNRAIANALSNGKVFITIK